MPPSSTSRCGRTGRCRRRNRLWPPLFSADRRTWPSRTDIRTWGVRSSICSASTRVQRRSWASASGRSSWQPAWEIGYAHVTLTPTGAEDILFSGFPMELPVFQWHRQGFDLPAGALHLAQGRDYPHQAFRHGKAWGFQFHLEVTPDLVDLWAGSRPDELNAADGLTREKLAEQAAASHQVVSLYGRQLIRRFWDALAEL